MSKKRDRTWEQLPQVEKIMKENKPVWIKEHRRQSMWESCVQEYLERDKQRWERRKQSGNN